MDDMFEIMNRIKKRLRESGHPPVTNWSILVFLNPLFQWTTIVTALVVVAGICVEMFNIYSPVITMVAIEYIFMIWLLVTTWIAVYEYTKIIKSRSDKED